MEPLEISFSEFDTYIRQGEPDQKEKADIWSVAIGLQQVDQLQTSEYPRQTAKRNIDGEITMAQAVKAIHAYYTAKSGHDTPNAAEEEADKVSAEWRVQPKTSGQIGKSSEKKTKTSVQILELLRDNPTYTAEKIGILLGKSTRAIEMQLHKLVAQNAICHIGSNKNGHWQIGRM